MSKSITLLGATYSGVPAVDLPQTGGGTARFIEPSVTTATAADVAAGKYFFDAAGNYTEGTSTGGGGGFVDVVETLPNGGQHHKISGVDLSSDTVTAAHLESGYTAHDAEGNAITGTLVPGGGGGATLITKSITANGTYDAEDDNADGYSSVTVNVSGGGGTSEPRKDVNFFDYDGTVLHSYTAQEALALNSLPSNPSHDGLTAQGWNYTLAEMKTEVTAQGKCDVGQMYITASGDTEIDVSFPSSARLSPIISFAVNGTVTVDWGDNTTPDTVTGTSLTTRKDTSHTYANAGNYTIKIHVNSGSFQFYTSVTYPLLRKNTSTTSEGYVYSTAVKAVRIGGGVTSIGNYGLCACRGLEYITMPDTITSIANYAFQQCYSLGSIVFPSSVVSIGSNIFYQCYSLRQAVFPSSVSSLGTSLFESCSNLRSFAIPSAVTTIGSRAFYQCYALAEVTIPSSVTLISGDAFNNDRGVGAYHLKPTTPPTLDSTSLTGIVSDCIIYVPSASLSTYQSASNWSSYSSYMQGE